MRRERKAGSRLLSGQMSILVHVHIHTTSLKHVYVACFKRKSARALHIVMGVCQFPLPFPVGLVLILAVSTLC